MARGGEKVSRRYNPAIKAEVAKLLLEKGREMKTTELAKQLEVSTRTLRNWKKNFLAENWPCVGRPKLDVATKLKTAKEISEIWMKQGCPGWRPIKAQNPSLSTRLIQKYVANLKLKKRKSLWDYKRQNATRTKVLHRDVIWTQDATYLPNKKYAEIIKDRASLVIKDFQLTSSLKEEETIGLLSGRSLPLVYMSDNGSAYCSEKMSMLLKKQRVIHLRSLPRVPQHNGAAEIAVKELKKLYLYHTENGVEPTMAAKLAKDALNKHRLYAGHGYRSAEEVEKEIPLHNKEKLRDIIYSEYENELLKIKRETTNKKKVRVMERKMIYALLEKHDLIKITRGC